MAARKREGRFYVYVFRNAAHEIVYIGKGKGCRFTTQNRRLNRREPVTGEIVWRTDDENRAYRAERLLIGRHKPAWNKHRGGNGGREGMDSGLCTRIRAARGLARKGREALMRFGSSAEDVDRIFRVARCRQEREIDDALAG